MAEPSPGTAWVPKFLWLTKSEFQPCEPSQVPGDERSRRGRTDPFHAQNKEEKGCLATAHTIRLQRRLLLFFLKFSSECIWTCPEVVEEGSCVIYLGSPRSHTKAFPEPPHSTGDAGQLFSPSLCSNLAHTETKELTLGATKGQRDSGRDIS